MNMEVERTSTSSLVLHWGIHDLQPFHPIGDGWCSYGVWGFRINYLRPLFHQKFPVMEPTPPRSIPSQGGGITDHCTVAIVCVNLFSLLNADFSQPISLWMAFVMLLKRVPKINLTSTDYMFTVVASRKW